MKIVDETLWGIAIRFSNGDRWRPFDREHYKKLNALVAARSRIRRSQRDRDDEYDIAIFNFARADFEQVPWS
jgi:hypothetical protein